MPESASTDSLETPIEQVVAALGKYYGAISRNDFVSMLLMRELGGVDAPAGFEVPDSSPGRVAARALLDVTEGGYTTPQLIQRLSEYVGNSEENDIPGLVKICYEPEVFSKEQDKAGVILRTDERPRIGQKLQGVEKPQSAGFSVKKIAGIDTETSVADGSEITINGGSTSPNGSEVNFSVIQVFANRLSPASRDMGALTLFMNAIPTLEMSRAVPFVDITLIQEGRHINSNNRISSLSLGQFLLGNATVDPDSPSRSFLEADDLIATNQEQRTPSFNRQQDDGSYVVSPISTAGMEIFTSPQTLVNADEDHRELDEQVHAAGSDPAEGGAFEEQLRRQSPVIDKFRPLASLKSLSFDVNGAGGMMSYKSGKMSLVVHDRSRLAEVSALVNPARFGSTHLMIEYGWSHPDAPVNRGLGPVNTDNLFGSLIGALRVKEKYQIVNTSFSFDEVGQINIEASLSMLAARTLRHAQIGLGLESSPEFNQLKHTTDMIAAIRSRISTTTAQAVFGESDIIGSLTNPQGAVAQLSPDVIRQIRRLTTSTQGSQNSDLRALGEALVDLMGQSGGSGRRQSFIDAVKNKIDRKVSDLRRSSDPFFVEETGQRNISSRNYVSLGKILTSFLAEPICVSGHFKDVQIIFYNFNEKASYMANRNIATFPIEVEDFKDTLKQELDQLVNMPVETFANFMGTYFISDPGANAYGFSGQYKSNRDDDSQRQLKDIYKDDNAKLFTDQQNVLKSAYGADVGSDLEFKQPTVSIIMESVPLRSAGQSNHTVLRMHVVDAQATSHATVQALLEAASSKTIGLVNDAAINAQQRLNRTSDSNNTDRSSAVDNFEVTLNRAISDGILEPYPPETANETRGGENDGRRRRYRIRGGYPALKKFMMRTVPSVRYGEGNSGILSANVSSLSDPAMTTVMIQRQGVSPETPATAREQGLPLDINPVECNLETIGCPLWSYGQQIFIDFGTGTTMDSIYGVTGVSHTIEPGNFKTSVKLKQMSSYARYKSLISNVEDAIVAINQLAPGDPPLQIPEPPPRRRGSRRSRPAASSPSGSSESAWDRGWDPFDPVPPVSGAAGPSFLESIQGSLGFVDPVEAERLFFEGLDPDQRRFFEDARRTRNEERQRTEEQQRAAERRRIEERQRIEERIRRMERPRI